VGKPRKAAVVKTLLVFFGARARIMGVHVSTRDHPAQRWQGAPVLEHRRESAPARWWSSGRRQRHLGWGIRCYGWVLERNIVIKLKFTLVEVLDTIVISLTMHRCDPLPVPARAPRASTKVCTQPTIDFADLTGQALTPAITPKISKLTLE